MAAKDDFCDVDVHPAVLQLKTLLERRGFPVDRALWTMIPPTGTELRCHYDPPCDFHRSGGDTFGVCRWYKFGGMKQGAA